MQLALRTTLDEIAPQELQALSDGGLDFSYGLLAAVERSLWGHLSVVYLCVEDQGTLVAFTPVYLGSNLNFNALLPQVVQRSYRAQVDLLGTGAAYTVAVVGCLISDRGWIPMHPGLDRRAEALGLLLRAVDRLCHEHKADLALLKDIHQQYPDDEKRQMAAVGYVQGYSLPTIRVDTGYGSFDDYLQSHLTKNGRKHARKAFRKAEGRLRLRVLEDFEGMIPRVYPLFRGTFLKAKYQFEELPPRFFVECARSRWPRTELVLCEEKDDLVGALLIFYDETRQLNKRIGVDYDHPDGGLIYNLLNYQGLIRAIERRIPTVYLGQSTYLPKIRMGGQLEDQHLFVKGYNPVIRLSLPAQRAWMARYRAEKVLEGLKAGRSI
jgi:hypothetical protein